MLNQTNLHRNAKISFCLDEKEIELVVEVSPAIVVWGKIAMEKSEEGERRWSLVS